MNPIWTRPIRIRRGPLAGRLSVLAYRVPDSRGVAELDDCQLTVAVTPYGWDDFDPWHHGLHRMVALTLMDQARLPKSKRLEGGKVKTRDGHRRFDLRP